MNGHLQTALAVAYRHIGDATTTTDAERDAILAVIAIHNDGPEGEAASRALHHRREARLHQMQLTQLFTARRAA